MGERGQGDEKRTKDRPKEEVEKKGIVRKKNKRATSVAVCFVSMVGSGY